MLSVIHGLPTALLSIVLLLPIALSSFSGWSFSFVRMFTLHRKALPFWHHHSHVTSPACALVFPHWGTSCLGLLRVQENTWSGSVREEHVSAKNQPKHTSYLMDLGCSLGSAASGCQTQDNWAVALWSEQMGQSHALGRKDPAERKWKGMFFLAMLCAEGALMVWVAIFLLLWN